MSTSLRSPRWAWMVALALAAPLAAPAQEVLREGAGVRFISGGVGGESRERLAAQAAQFNVRVIFALTAGNFLSRVEVSLRDAAGKEVFATVTDGPWLFASVAPGAYAMRATAGGQVQEQKFNVPAQGARQLVFRFERDE